MDRPGIGPEKRAICVGRTQSVEEANALAERYGMQGFETWISRVSQGGITIYEVWASKGPDILQGMGRA